MDSALRWIHVQYSLYMYYYVLIIPNYLVNRRMCEPGLIWYTFLVDFSQTKFLILYSITFFDFTKVPRISSFIALSDFEELREWTDFSIFFSIKKKQNSFCIGVSIKRCMTKTQLFSFNLYISHLPSFDFSLVYFILLRKGRYLYKFRLYYLYFNEYFIEPRFMIITITKDIN